MYVGSKLCGTVKYVSTTSVYAIECEGGPLTGGVVKILKEGDYLTLCEVQILGELYGGVVTMVTNNMVTMVTSNMVTMVTSETHCI